MRTGPIICVIMATALFVMPILFGGTADAGPTNAPGRAGGDEEHDESPHPWPMIDYEPGHKSLSPHDTRGNDGSIRWSFQAGGEVHSSPAVDRNGTIYFLSKDNNLYAVKSDGTLKWKREVQTVYGLQSPAIGSDNTIYIGSEDGWLYAFNPDGSTKWRFSTSSRIGGGIILGDDGTIYFGSNGMYALYPDGKEKWFANESGAFATPSIGPDGTVYYHCGYVMAFDPKDGSLEWESDEFYNVFSSPCVNDKGSIFIAQRETLETEYGSYAGTEYKMCGLNSRGAEIWEHLAGHEVYNTASIGEDGTVYHGSEDGCMYALNPETGTELWVFDTGSDIDTSPSISSDGTLYFGAENSRFYAVSRDGDMLWNTTCKGGGIFSSSAIGSDGVIYVTSAMGYLYAIGVFPPTPPRNLTQMAGDGFVELAWKSPADDGGRGVQNYSISRRISGGNWTPLGHVPATYMFYNDTSVVNGESYEYMVKAQNEKGPGEATPVVHASPEAPPPPGEGEDGGLFGIGDGSDDDAASLAVLAVGMAVITVALVVVAVVVVILKRRRAQAQSGQAAPAHVGAPQPQQPGAYQQPGGYPQPAAPQQSGPYLEQPSYSQPAVQSQQADPGAPGYGAQWPPGAYDSGGWSGATEPVPPVQGSHPSVPIEAEPVMEPMVPMEPEAPPRSCPRCGGVIGERTTICPGCGRYL